MALKIFHVAGANPILGPTGFDTPITFGINGRGITIKSVLAQAFVTSGGFTTFADVVNVTFSPVGALDWNKMPQGFVAGAGGFVPNIEIMFGGTTNKIEHEIKFPDSQIIAVSVVVYKNMVFGDATNARMTLEYEQD